MSIPDITRLSNIQLHQLKTAIFGEQAIRRLHGSKPEAFQKVSVQQVSYNCVGKGRIPTWYISFNDDMNCVLLDMQDTFFSATNNTLLRYRRICIDEAEILYSLEPRKYIKKSGYAYTDGLGPLLKWVEKLDQNADVIEMIRWLVNGINIDEVEKDSDEELWEWLRIEVEYFKKGQASSQMFPPSSEDSQGEKWSLLRFMMGS
jgi:hypothetical protein